MRTGKEVEWTQVNFASYSLKDYCAEVEYSDGTIELLEVKGNVLLIGGFKR